jgi:hypothetical protein
LATLSEAERNGWNTVAVIPVKHFDMQAAIKTHLSQSTGTGAFDGQHGMTLAISSTVADMDISFGIADIDASGVAPAVTGEDSGANTSPAIMTIASRRRMVIWRFTPPKSHRTAQIDSLPSLTTP